MLEFTEIMSYGSRLFLCPHCGGSGEFELITKNDVLTTRTVCNGCGHTSADFYPSKQNVMRLVEEWADGSPAPVMDIPTDSVLVANYGAGADSTAMLIAMVEAGIKPDLIVFSDVGSEKPETYAYIPYFDAWLRSKGFPGITVVAYEPDTAPYFTIEGNMLANDTLPGISFNFNSHSCSMRWKAEVMDRWIRGVSRGKNKRPGWAPAVEAWDNNKTVTKLIGYDYGVNDSKRCHKLTEDKRYSYKYPLRDLRWTREDCITAIKRAGLKVPVKSACYFCAASQEWEVTWLAAAHPDLLGRALFVEDNARAGKHGLLQINGLWGSNKESWREFCETRGIVAENGYSVVADREKLLQQAREMIPPLESNLDFGLPVDRELAYASLNKDAELIAKKMRQFLGTGDAVAVDSYLDEAA